MFLVRMNNHDVNLYSPNSDSITFNDVKGVILINL